MAGVVAGGSGSLLFVVVWSPVDLMSSESDASTSSNPGFGTSTGSGDVGWIRLVGGRVGVCPSVSSSISNLFSVGIGGTSSSGGDDCLVRFSRLCGRK